MMTLGRALDTLYETGLTELYSSIAATAARRLGLTPTFTHLDTTSFHLDGRYNSAEAPTTKSCTLPMAIVGTIGPT